MTFVIRTAPMVQRGGISVFADLIKVAQLHFTPAYYDVLAMAEGP